MTKILNPPLRARKFLILLTWKMKIFWASSKEICNFELYQREFFNPPQKKCRIFSSPPQAGLQNILTPLTSRPPPYCWVKNDQPLIGNIEDLQIKSFTRFTFLYLLIQWELRLGISSVEMSYNLILYHISRQSNSTKFKDQRSFKIKYECV